MIEKKQYVGFEYFPSTNSFTIHKDLAIIENDIEIARSRNSRGFSCIELDDLVTYIGDPNDPLIALIKSYWTADVIEAFSATQVE